MKIGDNLREIRHKQKISQQEIADNIGVDLRTYKRWESNEASIKDPYIPKIAKFLKVEIKELFREKPSEIVINQHNDHADYKDSSTNNSIVVFLIDKEDIVRILEALNKRDKKE